MASDYDLYLTVGESVPYVQYFVKAIKIFDSIINFGRQSDEQRAIAELEKQVAGMRRDLQTIKEAVDRLNRRVAQNENLARLRWIREHSDTVQALTFRLKRDPDVDQIAAIAHEAGLCVSTMIGDDDLWLWSDIGTRKLSNGQQITELVDPEFNVFPLQTFGTAVALFTIAASMHIQRQQLARTTYSHRFTEFLAAVSVRKDWMDLETIPVTLPEKIRARLQVEGVAATKFAVNGRCTIGLYLKNHLERTRTHVTDVSLPMRIQPQSTNPILCTWPPNLGIVYEHDFEDQYVPIKLLATLEDMLQRMKKRGTLVDPPPMRFPNETYHRLVMYGVEPSGILRRYTCDAWTSLKESPAWISTQVEPIGIGWNNFRAVLACEWNVLYAVTENRSILWYRHDGAVDNTFNWRGPNDVTPHWLPGYSTEDYIAGSDGRLYEIVRNSLGGNGGGSIEQLRVTRELTVSRLTDVLNGGGKLSTRVTLMSDVGAYKTVFGGGNGVVYGIDSAGRLYWHRHVHGGTSVQGPHLIGTGWNSFARVFGAESGFIFGVYPNGEMLAYRLNNWSSNPPLPPVWSGPVPVSGTNWSGFLHLVPMIESPQVIVN